MRLMFDCSSGAGDVLQGVPKIETHGDGGAGSDAEGEGGDGTECEQGTAAQLAEGEANIGPGPEHRVYTPVIIRSWQKITEAARFADNVWGAQVRCPHRLCRG